MISSLKNQFHQESLYDPIQKCQISFCFCKLSWAIFCDHELSFQHRGPLWYRHLHRREILFPVAKEKGMLRLSSAWEGERERERGGGEREREREGGGERERERGGGERQRDRDRDRDRETERDREREGRGERDEHAEFRERTLGSSSSLKPLHSTENRDTLRRTAILACKLAFTLPFFSNSM